jgi:molybdopterin-guanine dinucleotide biosynthesis protein A
METGRQQATHARVCHAPGNNADGDQPDDDDEMMDMMIARRTDVAAAILAGGQARRFGGRDKSRLVVDGRSIIVRQLTILQQVAGEVFVVGPTDGRFADLGLTAHPDIVAGAGAIGGVHTAIDVARASCVIVVACDLPFLDAPVLTRLVTLSAGHDAAWIRGPRGPEPLLACYQKSARAVVADRVSRGLLRAADLATALDIAWIESDELAAMGADVRLLANLNTPDDYARVQ